MEVLKATEVNPSSYRLAIAPEFDELRQELLRYLIQALLHWLDKQGFKSIPFQENMFYSQNLYNQVNSIIIDSGLKLKINEAPYDVNQNVLLNFSAEKYQLKEKKKVNIFPLASIPKEQWKGLKSGKGDDQHFFIVSRMEQYVLNQYDLDKQTLSWLEKRAGQPLVFLRLYGANAEGKNEQVQLFWMTNTADFDNLMSNCPDTPIISNISMHTWAIPQWASEWLDTFFHHSQCTILFDLSPHKQLKEIFGNSCKLLLFHKVWLAYEQSTHCALVLQGDLKEIEASTPLFFLPASETTCNVVIHYIQNGFTEVKSLESERLLQAHEWLIKVVLGHLYMEESLFQFNTI